MVCSFSWHVMFTCGAAFTAEGKVNPQKAQVVQGVPTQSDDGVLSSTLYDRGQGKLKYRFIHTEKVVVFVQTRVKMKEDAYECRTALSFPFYWLLFRSVILLGFFKFHVQAVSNELISNYSPHFRCWMHDCNIVDHIVTNSEIEPVEQFLCLTFFFQRGGAVMAVTTLVKRTSFLTQFPDCNMMEMLYWRNVLIQSERKWEPKNKQKILGFEMFITWHLCVVLFLWGHYLKPYSSLLWERSFTIGPTVLWCGRRLNINHASIHHHSCLLCFEQRIPGFIQCRWKRASWNTAIYLKMRRILMDVFVQSPALVSTFHFAWVSTLFHFFPSQLAYIFIILMKGNSWIHKTSFQTFCIPSWMGHIYSWTPWKRLWCFRFWLN